MQPPNRNDRSKKIFQQTVLLRVYFNRNRQTVSKTTRVLLFASHSSSFSLPSRRRRRRRFLSIQSIIEFPKECLVNVNDAHRIQTELIKFNKLCVPFCWAVVHCHAC